MSQNYLRTDLTTWEIGPYHGALPVPMRLKLQLDGEVIAHAEVETGFLHRGLEKACELHPWKSLVSYADHLDPEGAVFGEIVLTNAVEEIFGIPVPERAQCIRVILCELTRISSHLAYIVRMAKMAGSETIIHYVLRDRERVLDLFELLTGARFSINFLRYGGVRFDVTEGFIERVLELCELIRIRIKEYNDVFTYNHSFIKRSANIAPLSKELIRHCGITGPNARASGVCFDLRKTYYGKAYDRVEFEVPVGVGALGVVGDVHDRFIVRLKEVSQSIEILKQLVETIPSGEYCNLVDNKISRAIRGEAVSRVESSRGLLSCYVLADGKDTPARVQFTTSSMFNVKLIPYLISGVRIEDLPVVLASLDLSVAEADK